MYQGVPSWPQGAFQAPYDGLVRVPGMDGAQAYRMPPNSSAALFHATEDRFYVKTTDGAGFPTIREFEFSEVVPEKPEPSVTRADLDDIRKELANVEQLIRDATAQPAGGVAPGGAGQPAGHVRADDAVRPQVRAVRP